MNKKNVPLFHQQQQQQKIKRVNNRNGNESFTFIITTIKSFSQTHTGR